MLRKVPEGATPPGDTVTFRYSYDDAGNILTANRHTYTYGDADWGDLLTAYDGKSISYDGGGNPLSYNGWNFTWKKGRQLATATNGSTTVSYTYDADGLRTSKTVNGVVYTYYYVGSQLARMTYGDYVLDFFYDVNGTPLAMRQGYLSSNNYTVYYYITNLQGDVIRLVDVNGSTAAYYEYDPYGNAIQAAGSHCNINPLRYRGYIYDSESGLYYLQSRYYDPATGRFINADDIAYLGADGAPVSYNLFVYCKNNPVMGYDPTGHFSWKKLFHAAAAVTIAALAVVAVVGTGGSAAAPILATVSAVAGTTVTASTVTVAAAGVAVTGLATMGAAATADILESSSRSPRNSRQNNEYKGKSLYDKAGERIDFEYNGNGTGNVHYDGTKGKEIIWRLSDGKGTMCSVSKAVGKIISAPPIQKAISKAINAVLSLAGLK